MRSASAESRPRVGLVLLALAELAAPACAAPRPATPGPEAAPIVPSSSPHATASAPAASTATQAPAPAPPPAPATAALASPPAPAPSGSAGPVCTTKVVAPPLGRQPRCERDDQCVLISPKCCFCGEIPLAELRAAHVDGRRAVCAPGTTCPACVASPPEGITGACLHHVCGGVEKVCK